MYLRRYEGGLKSKFRLVITVLFLFHCACINYRPMQSLPFQLYIIYFIFQQGHHRDLHRAINVGPVGGYRHRRNVVFAPGVIDVTASPSLS